MCLWIDALDCNPRHRHRRGTSNPWYQFNQMCDLTFLEKKDLEKLFDMGGGYVLDFTDRTFQEFVADTVAKDIDAPEYRRGSGSKANRLRAFWKHEPNHIAGRLISAMADYAETLDRESADADLAVRCRKIASRLLAGSAVPDIDAISPNAAGRAFESVAKSVRESIDNNEPEVGVDRQPLAHYCRSTRERTWPRTRSIRRNGVECRVYADPASRREAIFRQRTARIGRQCRVSA